jgi:glycosyltransferase involved in cell wall biosynthesis
MGVKFNLTFDIREISGRQAGVGRIILSLAGAMQTIDPKREFTFVGARNSVPEIIAGTHINLGPSNIVWHLKCAMMLKQNPNYGNYISVRSPLVPIMIPERSVYFVNDLISFKYPEYFTYKTRIIESLFVKLALKKVKNIVAISNSTAHDIEELCPEAKSRTKIVPLAADPIFIKIDPDPNILNTYGINKPYILTVGTVEPRKNHLSLLKAYQGLPKALRDKYDLVIVGKRGWRCGHIMQAIDENVRGGSVKYLEFITDADLVHIYNGASLFVYPSFYEGFGLPVVEAMSCGVPVITSNASSLPEAGGEAAYYIDPYKPEEISDAMIKILTDRSRTDKMIACGFTQSGSFSWHRAAKALYNIIDNS